MENLWETRLTSACSKVVDGCLMNPWKTMVSTKWLSHTFTRLLRTRKSFGSSSSFPPIHQVRTRGNNAKLTIKTLLFVDLTSAHLSKEWVSSARIILTTLTRLLWKGHLKKSRNFVDQRPFPSTTKMSYKVTLCRASVLLPFPSKNYHPFHTDRYKTSNEIK